MNLHLHYIHQENFTTSIRFEQGVDGFYGDGSGRGCGFCDGYVDGYGHGASHGDGSGSGDGAGHKNDKGINSLFEKVFGKGIK